MQRDLTLTSLALVLLLACSDTSKPTPVETVTTGSASDACPPETAAKSEAAMLATDQYLSTIERTSRGWNDKTECEDVKRGLLVLEPAATTYVDELEHGKKWARSLSEACRDSLDTRFAATAKKLEEHFRPVVESTLAVVQRCSTHAGVAEAAPKALRLMRRKK